MLLLHPLSRGEGHDRVGERLAGRDEVPPTGGDLVPPNGSLPQLVGGLADFLPESHGDHVVVLVDKEETHCPPEPLPRGHDALHREGEDHLVAADQLTRPQPGLHADRESSSLLPLLAVIDGLDGREVGGLVGVRHLHDRREEEQDGGEQNEELRHDGNPFVRCPEWTARDESLNQATVFPSLLIKKSSLLTLN